MNYDREEVNAVAEQFQDSNPTEVKVYHANKKEIWLTENKIDTEPTICAKSIHYLISGITRYFVKREGCSFYEPDHVSAMYDKKYWKLAPVSKESFHLYLQFLGFEGLEECIPEHPKLEEITKGNMKGRKYLKIKAERII